MKLSHKTLIFLAGFVWLAIGTFLLALGIHFILETVRHPSLTLNPGCFSLSQFLGRFVSSQAQAVLWIMVMALTIGYFKGKVVLAKSVKRQVKRIESLPNPASVKHLYGKGYYLLILLMMSLGFVMRFLPITLEVRGAIDMTIGCALINGAMLFFRTLGQQAYLKKRNP